MNELTNTKTKVLLLLLLVAAGMGRAQELDGTRQWNVLFTKESTDIRFTVVFSFSDDDYVLYEGVQYKIMAAEEDDYTFDYGLLREDAGRLFFRKHSDWPMFEDEILLYDWTLSEGDTVFVQRGDEANGLVLSSIGDTIMNGVQRREFILSYLVNPDLKEKWIEDMGSELGFIFPGTKIQQEPYLDFMGESDLLCYHEEGELIWQNPSYKTCLINFENIQDNTEEPGVKVYPNPANGVVRIEGVIANEVWVFNALGQLVKTVRGTNEIDVADLADGVYLVRIRDENGKSHAVRVMVKE